MIAVVVLLALAVVALVYVLAPLLSGRARVPTRPSGAPPAGADEARGRKRAALEAIVDLEEEHAMGKLAEPDYGELLQRYEREAVSALEDLDAVRALTEEDPLEAEIAAARRRLECPSCGRLRPSGTTCPRCGD